MPVDPALIDEVRGLAATLPDDDKLDALTSIPALLGYIVAVARQEGWDECDSVEVLCRAAELTKPELRECIAVLKPLGYIAVVDRLKQLARLKRCH